MYHKYRRFVRRCHWFYSSISFNLNGLLAIVLSWFVCIKFFNDFMSNKPFYSAFFFFHF